MAVDGLNMGTMKNQKLPSETLACFVVGKAAADVSDRLCCPSCENPSQLEMHPSALRGWRDGCPREGLDKIVIFETAVHWHCLEWRGPRRALVDELSQPTEKIVIISTHFSRETLVPWMQQRQGIPNYSCNWSAHILPLIYSIIFWLPVTKSFILEELFW